MFCAVSTQKVNGLFFFVERTLTGVVYLYIQQWLMPQYMKIKQTILQQDGARLFSWKHL